MPIAPATQITGSCTIRTGCQPKMATRMPSWPKMMMSVARIIFQKRARDQAGKKRGSIRTTQIRAETEQNKRAAEQAIAQPGRRRFAVILIHGPCVHIAGAPVVKIARGGVMDRMLLAPSVIGGIGEQPGQDPHPGIGWAVGEEGAVAAVVEDDEDPHGEPTRRERQEQGKRQRDIDRPVHQGHEGQIGEDRGGHLGRAAPMPRLGIGGERPAPEGGVKRARLGHGWGF